jgi:LAO/AO transport system kinase
LTGGAILGDRIRVEPDVESSSPLAQRVPDTAAPSPGAGPTDQPGAFIRSMATRGHSGGLALAVPLAVRVFDAMGYDPVIVETVGVGQVEVDVVATADTAVVVLTPGMGDGVQANKAGLLEVADVFVVNKADRPGADDVRRDLELMLDLSHMTGQEIAEGYRPPILLCSALDGTGEHEVWAAVTDHLAMLDTTGRRLLRQQHRIRAEIRAGMTRTLASRIEQAMHSDMGDELVARVVEGAVSPSVAGAKLLDRLLDRR